MKGGGCFLRRKLKAVISIAAILALESITVFAASPTSDVAYEEVTSGNQEEENNDSTPTTTTTPATTTSTVTGPTLSGAGGDTATTTEDIVVPTTEQTVAVQETVTAKVEVQETKINDDGSKTIKFDAGTKDATTGEQKTVAVTENKDKTITVESSSGTTKTTFKEDNTSNVIQSTDKKEQLNITSGDSSINFPKVADDIKYEMAAKYATVEDQLTDMNVGVQSVAYFEAQGTPVNGKMTLNVPNAKATDNFMGLHKKGQNWENVPVRAEEGQIIVSTDSLSPFIIIKLDKAVSGITTTETTTDSTYAQPSSSLTNGQIGTTTSTISGDISPQTGESYPYAATISVIALACILACTKKRATK
jgi:hypothetical protein